jgi:hypothetical protein
MIHLVNISAIIKGFILVIIFTVIISILGFGSVLGLQGFLLGFLLAGIVVGYISYGGIIDGMINGALMGVVGAIILWILSLFKGAIATFSSQLSTYVPINTPQELIIAIVIGAVGGAIGAIILLIVRTIQKRRT